MTALPHDPDALAAVAHLDADRLVRVRQKIKAARDELSQAFKAEDERLKAQQVTIECALLAFLNATNQKSAKTEHGTFYWQEKLTPRGADWDVFYAWVAEHDAFEFLEKRITRNAVKKYMDDNDGAVPPGVDVYREREICVRKNND